MTESPLAAAAGANADRQLSELTAAASATHDQPIQPSHTALAVHGANFMRHC